MSDELKLPPTPRTDEFQASIVASRAKQTWADFACQLERDLATANDRLLTALSAEHRLRVAAQEAYGHLWRVNSDPGTPGQYSAELAASEARKLLRDSLSRQERAKGINTALKAREPAASMDGDGEQPTQSEILAMLNALTNRLEKVTGAYLNRNDAPSDDLPMTDEEAQEHLDFCVTASEFVVALQSQREQPVSPIAALKAQIQTDPEYAWSWHCNFAMPIMDWAGISRDKANDVAASLMQYLFDIDTRQHPYYEVTPESEKCEQPAEQQRDADDPAELWSRIHILEADAKGPEGFATWKDAALSERARRVAADQQRGAALDERISFEDWCHRDSRDTTPEEHEERTPENGQYYAVESTNDAYIGWRERAALSVPPAPESAALLPKHPPTECCHFEQFGEFPYPVMWNAGNKVVQCHHCGQEWHPAPDSAALEALARAVLHLNAGWNAKEEDRLIGERIDLARRLANNVLAKSTETGS